MLLRDIWDLFNLSQFDLINWMISLTEVNDPIKRRPLYLGSKEQTGGGGRGGEWPEG